MDLFKVLITLLFLASLLTTPTGAISAASSKPTPGQVQFFAFGDWGAGSDDQRAVAGVLKKFCAGTTCDFGLLLGDNFYPRGVRSVTDPKWRDYFEEIYKGLDLPFYVVLGNHDHKGNIQAQIDYTRLQGRWILPAPQYQFAYPKQAKIPLVEIFVLDSETWKPEEAASLKRALQKSRAQWKILAFHDPVYSNGKHGDDKELKKNLVPVLCNEADLILSGHDHLFSHLTDPFDGCKFHQVVVGTGGKSLYDFRPDPRVLFTESAYGFVSLKVKPTEILIQFHQSDGSIPYEYSLKKAVPGKDASSSPLDATR